MIIVFIRLRITLVQFHRQRLVRMRLHAQRPRDAEHFHQKRHVVPESRHRALSERRVRRAFHVLDQRRSRAVFPDDVGHSRRVRAAPELGERRRVVEVFGTRVVVTLRVREGERAHGARPARAPRVVLVFHAELAHRARERERGRREVRRGTGYRT